MAKTGAKSGPGGAQRASTGGLGGVVDWYRKRHPGQAREEEQLKREQRRQAREHAKRDRLRDDGTPATRAHAARVSQGSLARLYQAGHLTADQLAASQAIRQVAERIGADVAIGTVSLETRVDQSRRGDGVFFERLGAVRAEVAYTRWRRALGRDAAAVLAMVALDQSLTVAARSYRMRKANMRRLLANALDAWSGFIGEAVDEIDEATLLAAQAGVL